MPQKKKRPHHIYCEFQVDKGPDKMEQKKIFILYQKIVGKKKSFENGGVKYFAQGSYGFLVLAKPTDLQIFFSKMI